MKEDTTIVIIELHQDIKKSIKKMLSYVKQHRNTTFFILNFKRDKEGQILKEMHKDPKITYYTPFQPIAKEKAIKKLAKKEIHTTNIIIMPAETMNCLRYIPKTLRKLRKLQSLETNQGITLWKKRRLETAQNPFKSQHKTKIPI